ncbi:TetR/AcrR family transcriptional regulator [Acidipropionibacterium acidipropionici]|uniref:AcrR family transcriptional regulator n=1 Tax=Acidipropionibacterium acidipropionici TaxID=1748 RepID=A0AAC8YCY2_9ACTN|nr:TetR/AcrR family transcriptional regulator [Acidipropionibacterium acidipropionici]AMS04203.1 AcrR family transcriptional regulator [Acidipropionibacterium acidipropionici]AOZ45697.1 AcrR family transcriptional regulator [Acidipropionibacterium acidipropionici]AZP38294.1 TetR/AcrR family transcriptional regulator [Acidipropionibacterium acidipropionici]
MSEHETATGRPQDPAIDHAILRATQDLVIERGVAATTVDAVARAAGSGKAAVYRRWRSKNALVVAAVRDLYDPPETPDTGSLRDDLIACARHYANDDHRALLILGSVLSELGNDDELARAAYEAIGSPPARMLEAVLERWTSADVIPPTAPTGLVASVLPSIAFTNVVLRRETFDAATALDLVDRVMLPALLGS